VHAHYATEDSEMAEISNSWRYTDTERHEANETSNLADPMQVASDAAIAYVDGECQNLRDVASPDFIVLCDGHPPEKPSTIREAKLIWPGGAVTNTTVRVTVDPRARDVEIDVRYVWLPELRRGKWQVTAITP
jgi:hypothetical protein